jgi:hypothetical protein
MPVSSYSDEDEEEEKMGRDEKRYQSQKCTDNVMDRNKSKLEKLLAQADIFDCLRRIN